MWCRQHYIQHLTNESSPELSLSRAENVVTGFMAPLSFGNMKSLSAIARHRATSSLPTAPSSEDDEVVGALLHSAVERYLRKEQGLSYTIITDSMGVKVDKVHYCSHLALWIANTLYNHRRDCESKVPMQGYAETGQLRHLKGCCGQILGWWRISPISKMKEHGGKQGREG